MGDGGEDFVLEMILKSRHTRKHDDGNDHHEHHADKGNNGVQRQRTVALFCLEVAEADEYFVRKFHSKYFLATESAEITEKDITFFQTTPKKRK